MFAIKLCCTHDQHKMKIKQRSNWSRFESNKLQNNETQKKDILQIIKKTTYTKRKEKSFNEKSNQKTNKVTFAIFKVGLSNTNDRNRKEQRIQVIQQVFKKPKCKKSSKSVEKKQ